MDPGNPRRRNKMEGDDTTRPQKVMIDNREFEVHMVALPAGKTMPIVGIDRCFSAYCPPQTSRRIKYNEKLCPLRCAGRIRDQQAKPRDFRCKSCSDDLFPEFR
eukprot:GHVO01049282.1.p1 GENE.GHVO01049282.1~~GHVO01049282.1.p1  ORF type:complete len:104 (-),score=10.99 GHVO01049282.1:462-773(-)